MSEKWVILGVMGVDFEVSDDINDLLVPYISAEKITEVYLRASLGEISSFDFWNGLGFGSEYQKSRRIILTNA